MRTRNHVDRSRQRRADARPDTSWGRWRGQLARLLPERQIFFRTEGRVRFVTLTTRAQCAAVLAVVGGLAWQGYALHIQRQLERTVAAKEREIDRIQVSHDELRSSVADWESRFRTMARTLEAKHAYLMALLDRRTASPDALKVVPVGPRKSDPMRLRLENSRQALLAQLGALEEVLNAPAKPPSEAVPVPRIKPILTVSAPARLRRERHRLVERLDLLERRLRSINVSQRRVMNYLAARSVDDFDRAKKLVALSGLDVDRLLAKIGGGRGQGGPFVAAPPDPEEATSQTIPAALGMIEHQLDRWEKLTMLIGRLPLIAPADHYYVSSGFGKRRDPVNRRWAMHYGIDLAGVGRSPILATAPGVVIKAGWSGNYGRFVEIDHGLGIRTRYGHLRRILVRRGQKVGFRLKIGEMGSSGRSTGTHVHYEILVNGEPRDPEKFMQAGEHVLKGL